MLVDKAGEPPGVRQPDPPRRLDFNRQETPARFDHEVHLGTAVCSPGETRGQASIGPVEFGRLYQTLCAADGERGLAHDLTRRLQEVEIAVGRCLRQRRIPR